MKIDKVTVPWDEAPAFLTAPFLRGMFAGVAVSRDDGQRTILRFHWRQPLYPGVIQSTTKIWSP